MAKSYRTVDVTSPRLPTPSGSKLRVTLRHGAEAPRSVTLPTDGAFVGRGPQATLSIQDPTLSALHVELRPTSDGLLVRDCQSRNGAFLRGPVRIHEVLVAEGAEIYLGASALRVDEVPTPKGAPAQPFADLVGGKAPSMSELFDRLRRVADKPINLLLQGETGTGKDKIAKAIHKASPQRSLPFYPVDCSAIPDTLAESLLFGHRRGSFTGAQQDHTGALEAVAGGTLFLDEIAELSLANQAKLLRVLEDHQIRRLGEHELREVRFRLVCASHQDLAVLVNQGRFREDLHSRISGALIHVPPLRERREDIPDLVSAFLQELTAEYPGRRISDEVLTHLTALDHPLNVRGLKHMVQRLAAVADGPLIGIRDLEVARCLTASARRLQSTSTAEEPFQEAFDAFERGYLAALLKRHQHNISAAAKSAGIDQRTMRRMLERHKEILPVELRLKGRPKASS